MIYLDHAATTKVRSEVVEVITQALTDNFGNPSSIYKIGKESKSILTNAREKMAELLEINPKELYFTSGATEANNWALRSQAFQARNANKGAHIVATAIEHPSVTQVLKQLEKEGFEVTYLKPIDEKYTKEQFINASRSDTIGWTAMLVNNEVGSILPVKELGEVCKEKGYFFHVDAVQGLTAETFKPSEFYWTSFSGTAHKFNGPKGVGFLAYRNNDTSDYIEPLLYGGGQERKLRSGTENLPYIVGMVKAFELYKDEQDEFHEHVSFLRNYLIERLEKSKIDFEINGDKDNFQPQILNIWFKNLPSDLLLIQLDLQDIYVSAGSACSAGTLQPSPILQAYYPEETNRWGESLRISFGLENTTAELDKLVDTIEKASERILDK